MAGVAPTFQVGRLHGPVFHREGTRAIAITQIKELKSVHISDASDDE